MTVEISQENLEFMGGLTAFNKGEDLDEKTWSSVKIEGWRAASEEAKVNVLTDSNIFTVVE